MVNNLTAQQAVSTESESKQTLHRWLKRFQAASFGLVVGIFVKALFVSVNWTRVVPLEIPFWWMCFALSGVLPAVCFGLDVIILRAAVFTMRLDKARRLVTVTGGQAVIAGLGIILAALAWGALIVMTAYSALTFNKELLQTVVGIFTVVVGGVFAVSFLSTLVRDLSRTPVK